MIVGASPLLARAPSFLPARPLPALAAVLAHPVPADLPAPGVTVVMVSDTSLVLDSNKPTTEGPQAGYVAFRITNTSGAPLPGASVTLSGFANGIVLGGNQAATQYLGTLAAGEVRTVFWYIQYPTSFNVSTTLTATVTDATGSTPGSGTVRTRKMNSSNSGGNTSGGVLGPGAVIGQILWLETTYDFGGISAGGVYNIQPSGLTTFDAHCFQLVGSEVTASTVTAIPVGSQNQIFFTAGTSQTGSKFSATFRFYFKYQCSGVTSYAKPYASEQSGSTNLAYSGNWSSYVGPTFPAASNPFAGNTSKAASPTVMGTGGTATYTVAIYNPSPYTAYIDSIADVLPAGVSYQALGAGDVTTANSSTVPSAGATGRIVWRGTPGSSYVLTPGATLRLVYTALVPSGAGRYVNGVTAYAGTESVASASATITVGQADVGAAKTGPTAASPGDTIQYLVTLSNAGPAMAYGVVLRDSLPAGVSFVRATHAPTLSGRMLTWPTVDSLANGASRVDSVIVVAPGTAGTITNIALASAVTYDSAPSNNDGSAAGSRVTTTLALAIDVTPKGLASPLLRLPGSRYSQAFDVSNKSTAPGTYDLLASRTGTPVLLAIDSITGANISARTRPDSVRVPLAAGSTTTYTVWYTVPVGDTAVNLEYLRARQAADPTVLSDGWVQVRRVFPSLTLGKTVTPLSGPPGTDLTYTLTVANVGEYAARSVLVTDSVPAQTAFKLGSTGQTLPSGVTATVEYSSNGGSTWSYTPVSGGCSAPAGYDACVQRIRWALGTDLAAAGGGSSAQFTFVARIR